jgi:glycosyltransferase involved in cell wall biosynthesis
MMVSCILPTANRPKLLAAAIKLFLAQTYNDKELVILDDSDDASQWGYSDKQKSIRHVYEHQHRSLGEKMNCLVTLARGNVILHWSDDDWYAPWRIAYQVGLLEQYGDDACAIRNPLLIDAERKLAWHVAPPGGYIAPATLCYRRSIWERCPYEDVASGEDNGFLTNQQKHGATLVEALDYRCVVGRIHRSNTASREQMHDDWAIPFEVAAALVGPLDFDLYFGGDAGLPR